MILDFQNTAPTPGQDAAARAAIGSGSLYPWDSLELTAQVTWVDEPGVGTGNATDAWFLAYTTISAGSVQIELRRTLGLGPDAEGGLYKGSRYPPNSLAFLTESMHHELGHVVLSTLDSFERFPPLFYRLGKSGTMADWQPHGSAEKDQILEAVVETFKDSFLPGRVLDSFSNWRLPRENFAAFISAFTSVAFTPDHGTETILLSVGELASFHYGDPADHLHLPPSVNLLSADDHDFAAAPTPGRKFRFRWWLSPVTMDASLVLRYDVWAHNLTTSEEESYLTGEVGPLVHQLTNAPSQVVAVGDEGLIEVDLPTTIPPGYDVIRADCGLFGTLRSAAHPGPATPWVEFWAETSVFVSRGAAFAPPPWPYPAPVVAASSPGTRRYNRAAAIKVARRQLALAQGRGSRRVKGNDATAMIFN